MRRDPRDVVGDLIHPETQIHDGAVDLTVAHIFAIDEPGHLDFGGSELQLPATTRLDPVKRHPDHEYGWWSLEPGTYLVEYNETLTSPPAYIQPRDMLIAGGGMHASGWVHEFTRVGIHLGAGLELKENARISTVHTVRP